MLRALHEQNLEFSAWILKQAQAHRKTLSEPLAGSVRAHWQALAEASLIKQTELELADQQTFDDYLRAYLKR